MERVCEKERGAWIPRKVAVDFDARGKLACGYKSTITIKIIISGERRNAVALKKPKECVFSFSSAHPLAFAFVRFSDDHRF